MRRIKLLLFAIALVALLAVPGAAMAKDRDHDKMPDKWERHHGLSTNRANAKGDPDKDGLVNLGEFRSRTNPKDADSDNDGTEDADEDRDHDGCDNGNEMRQGTNPRDRDSDNDGRRDGAEDRDHDGLNNRGEDRTANDPRDRDSDDDGIKDGDEENGTVDTFDAATNLLTIRTTDGTTVSGLVTDQTEIKCETEDEREDAMDDHGDDGPGHERRGADDNSGPGSDSSGSDDGPNHDVGDDHGGDGPGSRHEHDGDEDNVCTTADLVAGARVHEAELELQDGQAVWHEVELLK
jgi:hypothetical protein